MPVVDGRLVCFSGHDLGFDAADPYADPECAECLREDFAAEYAGSQNGDDRFYWMDLNFEDHRPDLEASIAAGDVRCIVDEAEGIIGYALDEFSAVRITAALNAARVLALVQQPENDQTDRS